MRKLIGITTCVLLVLTACGSGDAGDADDAVPPVSAPSITTSDRVPSLEELEEMGLTDAQALCFTSTIDPEGTGRVQSVDLFVEAFSECFG